LPYSFIEYYSLKDSAEQTSTNNKGYNNIVILIVVTINNKSVDLTKPIINALINYLVAGRKKYF